MNPDEIDTFLAASIKVQVASIGSDGAQVDSYSEDRDSSTCFAADDVMRLEAQDSRFA